MKRKLFPLFLCFILLAGCGETVPEEQDNPGTESTTLPQDISYDTPARSDMFSNRDFETDYSDYVSITLSENPFLQVAAFLYPAALPSLPRKAHIYCPASSMTGP